MEYGSVVFLLGFLLGTIAGVIFTIVYGMYQLKKLANSRGEKVKALEEKVKLQEAKFNSIKERLNEAQQLTEKQFELLGALDQPSKNALHSKYKNNISHEVRQLEEDKVKILRSIILDGYDPEITILNEKSEKMRIKLSEYLIKLDRQNGVTPPPPPPENSKTTVKKIGKFVVYSGGGSSKEGKGDGEDTNNN
jgi:hypothetical protein